MAVQKDKKSKSRRNMRRMHDRLKIPPLSLCDHCGADKQPHHVCMTCGFYRSRQIIVRTAAAKHAAKQARLYSAANPVSTGIVGL